MLLELLEHRGTVLEVLSAVGYGVRKGIGKTGWRVVSNRATFYTSQERETEAFPRFPYLLGPGRDLLLLAERGLLLDDLETGGQGGQATQSSPGSRQAPLPMPLMQDMLSKRSRPTC